MVATSDLGSDAERRGGSSPFIRTSDCLLAVAFFMRIKGLGQLVAVWQCNLRLSNVQSCCATLEYRLRISAQTSLTSILNQSSKPVGLSAHSPRLHCSNLRQPFELRCDEYDNLPRYRTKRDSLLTKVSRFFAYKGTRSACCASADLSSQGGIAVAITCLCQTIVFENKFSDIVRQTQTISDCTAFCSVCSRLLPPFESHK